MTNLDLIHINEATKLSKLTKPYLVRQMNASGVTRIGDHYVREEFIEHFRSRAQERSLKINLPYRHAHAKLPKINKEGTAGELIKEHLMKEQPLT